MKIRWDFVTNSSSTCFVVICQGYPDKSVFVEAMGASGKSPLRHLFESLFSVMCDKMSGVGSQAAGCEWTSAESMVDFIKQYLSKEAALEVEEAFEQGKNVYAGWLDSDGPDVESFFCCEPFEINHPELRVNAIQCTW